MSQPQLLSHSDCSHDFVLSVGTSSSKQPNPLQDFHQSKKKCQWLVGLLVQLLRSAISAASSTSWRFKEGSQLLGLMQS